MGLASGSRLDHYEVMDKLGQGGMGDVPPEAQKQGLDNSRTEALSSNDS